jgi:CheY-like chemotaxis protein
MPEMDGLALLAKIDEMNAVALKSVVVSAYGDMENIRVAMNRGAFDFVTKPIDLADLETTIYKALRESSLIKEALRTRDELVAIQRNWNVATEIQMSMRHARFRRSEQHGVAIYASMFPPRKSAATLRFLPCRRTPHGFVIGDMSKASRRRCSWGISRTLLRARVAPASHRTHASRWSTRSSRRRFFPTCSSRFSTASSIPARANWSTAAADTTPRTWSPTTVVYRPSTAAEVFRSA